VPAARALSSLEESRHRSPKAAIFRNIAPEADERYRPLRWRKM